MVECAMRYLVFGGSGYLGSHLVEELIVQGHEIVVFDNLSGNVATNYTLPVKLVFGDISNVHDFKVLDSFENIDGAFHLAAKKSVPESLSNPHIYKEVNETGTNNVISYCIRRGINHFVFTSSAAVYGKVTDSTLIDEKFPVSPINPYGTTKLKGEINLADYCRDNELKAVSLRTFNIVGSRRKEYFDVGGDNVLPVIARALKQNSLFTLFGKSLNTVDGTSVRDYVNVQDVAKAHSLAMDYLQGQHENSSHQILNVSSGIGVSLLELISRFNYLSEKELKWVYGETRNGDPASVIGNNELADQLLGWKPQIGLDQSVRET
jgi:UDP-glucose 4-epimerase